MNRDDTPKRAPKSHPAAETRMHTPEAPDTASDVRLASDTTAGAPSLPSPGPAPAPVPRPPVRRDQRPPALPSGARIDDFEIVRTLGRGAFGHVYLARQLSLDREVALKVSANRGSEGRTMARLEHAHIVQVFSEKIDETTDQRLLCMQLVPGVGLEKIIGSLGMQMSVGQSLAAALAGANSEPASWRGSDMLAIIDINASLPSALDPAALRDREALADMDAVEATAWIGARLAEALDFAHQRGVLHRDVKPANILVSPYGRPMLADFNISSQQVHAEGEELFGGTIAYMAPEHLDAFNPADATKEDAVTERADVYSLGLVLDELLSGRPPRQTRDPAGGLAGQLRALADQRRQHPPLPHETVPGARKTLEQTICRSMAADPADRFAAGAQLAEQLEGCRQLRQAERALPPATGIITRKMVPSIMARPFLWFLLLVLAPQVVASAINITYNESQIAEHLTADQRHLFMRLVTLYNAVAYPIAIALFAWAFFPVRRTWLDMHGPQPLAPGRVAEIRREALRLPLWVVGLTAAGWLPGAILFPAVISARTGMLSLETWLHFIASFTLSALIALAYSLCGSQFVIQRALYPRMWDDVRHFTATARQELAPMASRLVWIHRLAASAFVAAVLVLGLSNGQSSPVFRGLVIGLILLGMFGYQLASRVTRSLTEIVLALTAVKG